MLPYDPPEIPFEKFSTPEGREEVLQALRRMIHEGLALESKALLCLAEATENFDPTHQGQYASEPSFLVEMARHRPMMPGRAAHLGVRGLSGQVDHAFYTQLASREPESFEDLQPFRGGRVLMTTQGLARCLKTFSDFPSISSPGFAQGSRSWGSWRGSQVLVTRDCPPDRVFAFGPEHQVGEASMHVNVEEIEADSITFKFRATALVAWRLQPEPRLRSYSLA